MASISGAAQHAAPGPRLPVGGRVRLSDADEPLFTGLVVSNPPPRRGGLGWGFSAITHVVVLAALVLVPILLPGPVAEAPDYVRALIYNPPPPPPPPLPKGTALVERKERPKPVAPDDQVKPRTMVAEVQVHDGPLVPEDRDRESEQFGSPTGSDFGVPEGSEFGVEGGVVGGVPGGVLGGVIGGTGDGPVMDYDQPPKLLKRVNPIYPQEAFVKKIEGTVLLEILIDSTGRVSRVRVVNSIPALDQAAIETVKQWVFAPAIKRGRPVATVATAPLSFRIF
jgi:protein TonB